MSVSSSAKRSAPEEVNTDERVIKPKFLLNQYNKPYQYEDSDITLISSDNLHFKVHSYHLMVASPVFRDMIRAGNNSENKREVTFTDPRGEMGQVIASFLDLCYGKPLVPLPSRKDSRYSATIKHLSDLLSFLTKYECEVPITAFKLYLGSWAGTHEEKSDDFFRFAAQLDDVELAVACLKNAEILNLLVPTDPDFKGYADFNRMPDGYKFALLRAYAYSKGDYMGRRRWEEIISEMKKVLIATRAHK
ncbi:hypothetical protein IAU59_002753 [Kwoniella sp. CBS 9459]